MPQLEIIEFDVSEIAEQIEHALYSLPFDARVDAINTLRAAIHKCSPFKNEPVDFVRWVPFDDVQANDYNPNSVAPPEMELLRVSIMADGYTQPIVTFHENDRYTVVDGFHRNRVGKECGDVRTRVRGFLPVVKIRESQEDRGHRIASTIRHNRARGKHKIEAMSDIVIELVRRNWTTSRICTELGMDEDEVLRLKQITGLAEMFADQEFSKSWDVEGSISEEDFTELADNPESISEEIRQLRTVNTNDENRIFHTFDKWECHKAGFYENSKPGLTKAQAEEMYRSFLADEGRFRAALRRVITEWKNSCEHYLTNAAMNRIAWLGQASACIEMGLPSVHRSGFSLLTEQQQETANLAALDALNEWLVTNGRPVVTLEEAYSGDRQSEIY